MFADLSIINVRKKDLDSTRYGYKFNENTYGLDVAFSDDMKIDENKMAVIIPFADGNRRDGVGDLLEVGGIDTERHQKNPVVLLDHGKQCALPIALAEDPETKAYTVSIDPIAKCAKALAFFYRGTGMKGITKGDEFQHALFCEQLFDLIAKRYIRGGSIGYSVKKAMPLQPDYERGTPQGLHLLSVLMLECSAVVLPANQDTTRKMLALPAVCGKPLSPILVKSLSSMAPEETKTVVGFATKSLRLKYRKSTGDSRAGQRQLGTVPADGESGPLPNLEDKLEERELQATGKKSAKNMTGNQEQVLRLLKRAVANMEKPIPTNQVRSVTKLMIQEAMRDYPLSDAEKSDSTFRTKLETVFLQMPTKSLGYKSVQFYTAFDANGKPIRDFNSAFLAQTDKFSKQDKERMLGLSHGGETEADFAGQKVRVVRWKSKTGGKAMDFKPFQNVEYRGGVWTFIKTEGNEAVLEDLRHNQIRVPLSEVQYVFTHSSRFDIKSIRMKYRQAKNYRRKLRKSVAGSSVLHVAEKDLPAVKQFADDRGMEFKRVGSGGMGLERVKLIGSDGNIDEAAKRYGKSMPKTEKGMYELIDAIGLPIRMMGDPGLIRFAKEEGFNDAWIDKVRSMNVNGVFRFPDGQVSERLKETYYGIVKRKQLAIEPLHKTFAFQAKQLANLHERIACLQKSLNTGV